MIKAKALRTQQVAALVGVSMNTIQRDLAQGTLPGYRVKGRGGGGQNWVVLERDIPAYMEFRQRRLRENARRAASIRQRRTRRCCPRCDILTDDGELCPDCRAELAHQHYAPGGAFWSCE